MRNHCRLSALLALLTVFACYGLVSARAPGPPEELVRKAFQNVKTEADSNKDGKLTVDECIAIFKDKSKGEKNCKFWDANKDGTITEDEYVSQVRSIGRR
jgi:hypothetical protein